MGHPQYRACIRVLVNRVPVYDHKSLTDLMSESIVNWALNIVNWVLNNGAEYCLLGAEYC